MPSKPKPTGTLSYVLVAFVAMSGLAYLNFLPSVLGALAGEIGWSESEAGQIVAANGYGGLVGSAVAIFIVRRVPWRATAAIASVALAGLDGTTVLIEGFVVTLSWRFLAGFFGGLSMGVVLAAMARWKEPDRGYGILLLLQFLLGSLVVYQLPRLAQQIGPYAVFALTAAIALTATLCLPLLPSLGLADVYRERASRRAESQSKTAWLLIGVFLYQSAAGAIWAYVGLIGQQAGNSADRVTESIALTGLLGIGGALLPTVLGKRYGRLVWITLGVLLSAASAFTLHYADAYCLYVASMALLFFSWPAVQAFLLAASAELDATGQLSSAAGLAAALGLASGPLFASSLLRNGDYTLMLQVCTGVFLASWIVLLRALRQKNSKTYSCLLSQR